MNLTPEDFHPTIDVFSGNYDIGNYYPYSGFVFFCSDFSSPGIYPLNIEVGYEGNFFDYSQIKGIKNLKWILFYFKKYFS